MPQTVLCSRNNRFPCPLEPLCGCVGSELEDRLVLTAKPKSHTRRVKDLYQERRFMPLDIDAFLLVDKFDVWCEKLSTTSLTANSSSSSNNSSSSSSSSSTSCRRDPSGLLFSYKSKLLSFKSLCITLASSCRYLSAPRSCLVKCRADPRDSRPSRETIRKTSPPLAHSSTRKTRLASSKKSRSFATWSWLSDECTATSLTTLACMPWRRASALERTLMATTAPDFRQRQR